MSLTLAVTGSPVASFEGDTITLGSDARCTIQITDGTDVRRKHACFRRVDGIWMIQAYAENTFTVGRSQPLQTHRLRSGDVIRLSSDSSPIVFDPIEDKPLTIFDDDTPLTLVKDDEPMSLSTHEISLTETVPFLPVTTPKETPAVPSSNPAPKTGSISVPKSRSSDSIPAKSGTMRTTKSASSASVSTRKCQSSTSIATTKKSSTEISAQSRESDAAIDTNEVLRRSLEMAITDTDASETSDDADIIDLPVLQRLSTSSSWEEELPEAPRRRSAQKDEMKWVMMVVGRIVAAGAIVLVLLLIISAIRKSMETPTAAPVSMSVIESSATC